MNRWQKMAWYQIIVIIAVLTLTGTVVGSLTFLHGMPSARSGLGLLGLLGLLGMGRFFFPSKSGQISADERDLLIQKRSLLASYTVFWLLFVGGCMIPWFIVKIVEHKNYIPVDVLPIIVICGGIIVCMVQSVMILVQYGLGGKGNE
jgi:hypothetical protein